MVNCHQQLRGVRFLFGYSFCVVYSVHFLLSNSTDEHSWGQKVPAHQARRECSAIQPLMMRGGDGGVVCDAVFFGDEWDAVDC